MPLSVVSSRFFNKGRMYAEVAVTDPRKNSSVGVSVHSGEHHTHLKLGLLAVTFTIGVLIARRRAHQIHLDTPPQLPPATPN